MATKQTQVLARTLLSPAVVLLFVWMIVPLALTILGPVIVSILAYHLLMDPKGLPLAVIVTVLWFILFFRYKQNFSGIFAARPT